MSGKCLEQLLSVPRHSFYLEGPRSATERRTVGGMGWHVSRGNSKTQEKEQQEKRCRGVRRCSLLGM